MKKKITLFALDSIKNIGDEILGDVTKYLIENANDSVDVNECQLMPSIKQVRGLDYIMALIAIPLKIMAKCLHGNLRYRILNLYYTIKYYTYYKACISKADYVTFSVGMFKYSTQDFSYIYHLIVSVADKLNVPVMVSAASVEAVKESDWRSRQLKETFNIPSLKMFTTRDGEKGLALIKKDYLCSDKTVDYVGDPALWIPECYGIRKKQSQCKGKPHIGINLIRTGIFKSYGGLMEAEEVVAFYKELLIKLDKLGLRYTLFCNGMDVDYRLGLRLVRELNLQKDRLLPPPISGHEFAEMLLGFDVIFGARLHACITAFSLNIPVAGMIWDNKLNYFSTSMGIRQFFIEEKDLKADMVVEKIKASLSYNYEESHARREHLKNKTLQYLARFLS